MDIESTTIKLYEALTNDNLNDIQKEKLRYACKKTIIENPELDYNDWKVVAKIYLNFIVDFPELDLGEIIKPT